MTKTIKSIIIGFLLVYLNVSQSLAITNVRDIISNPQDNAIIVRLNESKKPQINMYKGAFPRIVIDIKDANLDFALRSNPNISKQITSNFSIIEKFIITEFGTESPTVRLVIQTNEDSLSLIKVIQKDSQLVINVPNILKSTYNIPSPPIQETNTSQIQNIPSYNPDPKPVIMTNNTSYESQINQLKEELALKEKKIKDQAADIEFLRQKAPAQLDKSIYSEDINQLKEQNNKLKEELSTTKSKLALAADRLTTSGNLAKDLDNAKSQINALKSQLSMAIEKIKGLSTAQPEPNDAKQELIQTKKDLEQANKLLSIYKQKSESAPKPSSNDITMKNQLDSANNVIFELKKQLQDLNSRPTNSKELDTYKNQIIDLKNQLNSMESITKQLDEYKKQIVNLKNQLNSIQTNSQNHEEFKNLVTDLKSQLNSTQTSAKEIEEYKKQIIELKNQLNIKMSDKNTLAESNKLVNSLKNQLNEANTAAKENEIQLKKALSTIEDLKKQVVKTSNKNIKTEDPTSEVTMLREENKKLKLEINKTASKVATSINNTNDTSSLTKKLEQVNDLLLKESKKSELLTEKNDLLVKKVNLLTTALNTGSNDERLKAITAGISDQNKEIENNLMETKNEINRLKIQLSQASSIILSQGEEIARLNSSKIPKIETSSIATIKQSNQKIALEHYKKAQSFNEKGDISSAIKALKNSIMEDPGFTGPYIMLGGIYTLSGDFNSALESLNKAIELDPGNNSAHSYLGNLYLAMGNFVKADQNFKEAIGINNLTNYASTLKNEGKLDQAINLYKAALTLSPNDPEIHYNLAMVYKNQNIMEKALEEYLIALDLKPDFSNAHYNLALTLGQLGKNKEAVNHFKAYLQLEPNSTDAETIKDIIKKLEG